jgi:hypothetical protein
LLRNGAVITLLIFNDLQHKVIGILRRENGAVMKVKPINTAETNTGASLPQASGHPEKVTVSSS